jgi:TniQ
VRRLPAQVDLLPFETFDSWCARVLKANAITSFELQDILIEARFFRVPESNLRSAGWASLDTYLPELVMVTGQSLVALERSRFEHWQPKRCHHLPLSPLLWLEHLWLFHQFCPQCLAEDPVPYARRAWFSPLVFACSRHRCPLLVACRSCSHPFASLDWRPYIPPKDRPARSCKASHKQHAVLSLDDASLFKGEQLQQFLYWECGAIPGFLPFQNEAWFGEITRREWEVFALWLMLPAVKNSANYAPRYSLREQLMPELLFEVANLSLRSECVLTVINLLEGVERRFEDTLSAVDPWLESDWALQRCLEAGFEQAALIELFYLGPLELRRSGLAPDWGACWRRVKSKSVGL